jgi:glycosyltransferase involved in cell wall biosynthesis
VRLGLFVDAAFRSDAGRVWCGEELLGFGRFASAVGGHFDSFTLIARGTEDAAATPFEMDAGVRLHALPHYGSLRDLLGVARAIPATVRELWRALGEVDLVWISASNPVGLILAALAFLRRRRVAVLVRQDSMDYFRRRLPSRRWAPLLAPLWLVDRVYRALGRRVPTTVVGPAIAAAYGAPRPNVHQFTVGLMEAGQLAASARSGEWSDPVRLLTVGRVEQEKNPLLLVDAMTELEAQAPGRYSATWAGSGRMRDAVLERAAARGLEGRIEMPGFVPFGDPLFGLYREADAFVHVSLTEGMPGVLVEAMAHGLPIVATDVGGIRGQTGDGEAALLVPPDDAGALAAAIRRLDQDRALRERVAAAGLERARSSTLEAEAGRVAAFLREG